MSAALGLRNRRDRDPRLFGPAIRAISIPELRAIAENPFRRPSERVAARTELRRRRREAEDLAGPAVLAERLRQKLAAGRPLTWRERLLAKELDLARSREVEAARIEPMPPLYSRRG